MNNYKPKRKARFNFGFIALIALIAGALLFAACPSPTGGTETGPYTITMQTQGSGTATASPNPAEEGDLVTITASPNDGYEFDKWAVVSGGVSLSSTTAESATFIMPAGAVTIRAEFKELPPNTPSLSFVPVVQGAGGSFESMSFGYTQPDAHTINLHNGGTGTATVASWDIDGDDEAFEVTGNTGTPTIAIGGNHELTVKPSEDLAPGVYNAELTVTYNDGKTATLNLSFTVTPLPIAAVNINLIAPVKGATPAALGSGISITTANPNFSITSITWDPDDDPFKGLTEYTAQITITANTGYTFAGTTFSPLINSSTTGVTVAGTRSETLVLSRQFAATDPDFVVNGNGTTYSILGVKEGDYDTIQDAITHIRGAAAGGAITIQFGDGTETLNIGNSMASFNTTGGGTWGAITLTGKISSTNPTGQEGTVGVFNDVSLTTTADIRNTNGGTNISGRALIFNSTGTLDITGGTIQAAGAGGQALRITNAGIVNISGAETLITSVNASTATGLSVGGTIVMVDADAQLNMTGGTVNNTASNNYARAINNVSSNHADAVIISGGLVTVTNYGGAIAIRNAANGVIHIRDTTIISGPIVLDSASARLNMTGGTVRSSAAIAIRNSSSTHEDAIIISGGTIGAMDTNSVHGGPITETAGSAIINTASGRISISGTDTLITGAANHNLVSQPSGLQGTIVLDHTGARLSISGGTVRNTSTGTAGTLPGYAGNARAIVNFASDDPDAIIITGGTIGAIDTNSVHGGTITATGGVAIASRANGNISISGSSTLIISGATGNVGGSFGGYPTFNPGTIFLQTGSGSLTVSDEATVRNTRDVDPRHAIYSHADHTGTVTITSDNIDGTTFGF